MIIQTNVYSCDICNEVVKITSEETSIYNDPVVSGNEGLLSIFTKFDKYSKIKMYSGYACNKCVDKFGKELPDFMLGEGES